MRFTLTLVSPLLQTVFLNPEDAPARLAAFSHYLHYKLQSLSTKPRRRAGPSLDTGYQMQSLRSH